MQYARFSPLNFYFFQNWLVDLSGSRIFCYL